MPVLARGSQRRKPRRILPAALALAAPSPNLALVRGSSSASGHAAFSTAQVDALRNSVALAGVFDASWDVTFPGEDVRREPCQRLATACLKRFSTYRCAPMAAGVAFYSAFSLAPTLVTVIAAQASCLVHGRFAVALNG